MDGGMNNPQPEIETQNEPKATTAVKTKNLSDEDYAARVRGWYKECLKQAKDALEEEEEDFAFYAGHQWSVSQKARRDAEDRPTLTLNYCLPMVNAVVGEERLNRQEIKVYGRDGTPEDDAGAHAYTELIRWIMQSCNGDYAVSKGFRSAVIGGRGWLEVRLNYLDDLQGKIEVVPVKAKEMHVDPLSEAEDLSDARYLIREKWLPEDEIEAMWPGKLEELKRLRESRAADYTGHESTPKGDAYSEGGDKIYEPKDGTWQILEAWHYEVVPGGLAINPETGQLEELKADELDMLLADNQRKREEYEAQIALGQVPLIPPPSPIEHVRRPIKCYYQGFVCGDVVLQRGDSPHRRLKRFPYIPIFGMRDDEKCRWFGIIRPIKDAQRQHNVEQSAILHWTQTMPKAGWMAPRGAFVDRKKWETRSSKPGFIGEYNPSRGKPEPIQPPGIPRHILELAQTRLQSIRDISGVNMDLMGQGVKDTPGVVMELRRKMALTVLQTLFDNLSLARRILGEVLICFIQQYLSDDRKVRVLGPDGAMFVELLRDYSFKTYDAVVEESPESPTDKMATMYILQTTLPMILKAGLPVPPGFVDILPITPKLKAEWKALLAQMMGPPPGALPPGAPPQPPPGGPNAAPPPPA